MNSEKSKINVLNISNLSVNIKSLAKIEKVLNNIDFKIDEKEIVAIIGETGSGKTVFAKTILGYNNFYEGKILLADKEISTKGRVKLDKKNFWIYENVQMLFQDSLISLDPNETIRTFLFDSFKNFDIIRKEKEKVLNLNEKAKNKIDNNLFRYKYPEKYISNQMKDKVNNILKNEEQSLYKEKLKSKYLYEKKQKLELLNKQINELKYNNKFFKKNYREKINFWKEEEMNEIRTIKYNFHEDENVFKSFYKQEKTALKYKDKSFFLKKLNINLINNEFNGLLKTLNKNIENEFELKQFFDINKKFLNSLKNSNSILKKKKEFILFLKNLFKLEEKSSSIEKQKNKIIYIQNLLDETSAINSLPFNFLNKYLVEQINLRIKEQTDIINNLTEYIEIVKNKNKKVINKNFLELKKNEVISLNYELVIFRELKAMFLNFLKEIQKELHLHTDENIKKYYKMIVNYNKFFFDIYFSIMYWKFKNQKRIYKKEFKLQKSENSSMIVDKINERQEIKKIIKNNKWITDKINKKLERLRNNLIIDINKREIKKIVPEESNSRQVNKKIHELEYERKRILKRIEEAEKIYSKKNKKNLYMEKIKEIFEFLELPLEVLNLYPFQLSTSLKQKIALANALIIHPKLLIADESINYLDGVDKLDFIDIFKKIKEKYNISILFITKDFEISKYISDRIYIFQNGSIVEFGDTNLVYKNSTHPYTKYFLNNDNLLKTEKKSNIYEKENRIQIYNRYKDIITLEVEKNHFVRGTFYEIEKWLSNSNIKKNIENVKKNFQGKI